MSASESTHFDSKAAIVEDEMKEISFRAKVLRTFAVALAWLCMGLYSEISGPTLPYLINRVDGNYEEISRALVARNVGFLSSSFFSGILCERFRSYVDVWMALSLAMAGGATAAVPWCRSLTPLAAMLFVDGMGKGILAAGGSAFVIRMWLGGAAVPVHAIHLAFDIGALTAPQIVRPFLGEWTPARPDVVMSEDAAMFNSTHIIGIPTDEPGGLLHLEDVDIEYPYAIVAGLTLLVSAIFVMLFCFAKSIRQGEHLCPASLSEVINQTAWCESDDPTVAVQMIPTLFFAFLLPSGAERAYGRFVFALAVIGRTHMSPAEGALLDTLFWTSFAVGLVTATACARWVAPLKLLLGQVTLYCLAAASLSLGGESMPWVLWAGTAILGVSLAPIFPTLLTWTNEHFEVTATLTSLAFAACACGSIIGSWLGGYLFQYYGPAAMLHFILVTALLTAAVLARLYMLARRCHARLERDLNTQETVL